jgi:xanthine dehydrogenase YagT iron-sulfur-binding subunit
MAKEDGARDMSAQGAGRFSRRRFLQSTAASTAGLAAWRPGATEALPATGQAGSDMRMHLKINGRQHDLDLDPRTTLLDTLREHLALTGTKKGCDQGQCGACTVHIDGHRILSCLTLAVGVQGREVTTVEGLSDGDRLHPMQQAFIDQDAFQCGYCTPGQIMSAVACINEGHANSDAEIREYMSGNLCRCAAYPNIVAAIKQAKTKLASSE